MSSAEPVLATRWLSKTFGSTRALERVSLEIRRGEIHALVGQNGSGKSTLIKVISGYYVPDEGTVEIHGRQAKLPLPAGELRRLGISFVHQDLGLVETMSVLDNLRVGRYQTRRGRILWSSERARTRQLLNRFGVDLDPHMPVHRLTQTVKVIIAIVRALQNFTEFDQHGLLVLDEPTAALSEQEVERLFSVLRRVKDAGYSVLFVTHRLEEVLAISDRVSVLRDGRLVVTRETSSLDERELIGLITGHDLGEIYPEITHQAEASVLEVRGLCGSIVRDISFVLRKGEILGLTGLVGAGHEEVPYLIFGGRSRLSGEVEVAGNRLKDKRPEQAKELGLAFLPADRQRLANLSRATVRENVTLPFLHRYTSRLGLDLRRERREVLGILERFHVQPVEPDRLFMQLSGGNQQKALLARWLQMKPSILLLHEPTQGVDIGSRQAIFAILRDSVAASTSIVYASVEYEDLAHLCDRVLIFRRGRIVRELTGATLVRDAIVEACYRTGD